MTEAQNHSTGENPNGGTEGTDPLHDFTVPQDADFVAAPTPNSESDDDSADDGDPLGSDA